MPTTPHHLIHGLVVASEAELPLPIVAPRSPDVVYRVELGRVLPPPTVRRRDDPAKPWAIESWFEGGHAVEFPNRAIFEYDRRRAILVEDEVDDPEHIAHLLVDHVVPRIVVLRGDLMLHASGVVGPSGRAHLFLGQAGAGKSTIATQLALKGWTLLDDDGVRVVSRGHESFAAFPGSADVRLLPDVADRLLPGVLPGVRTSAGSAKRRYAAGDSALQIATVPASVVRLYVLDRAADGAPSLERLGFAQALTAVARHGFHIADRASDVSRLAFERAANLAAAVPVSRLAWTSRIQALDTVLALVEAQERQPGDLPSGIAVQ